VSSNVDPEEVQAIMNMMDGDGRVPANVAQRDFRKPMRLSQPQIDEIQTRLLGAITPLSDFLSENLGHPCRVDLSAVGEASAESLFDDLGEHFALLRFRSRGQIAWVRWDIRAAIAALERIFGVANADPEARHLTRMETQILGNLLAGFAAMTTEVLEVDAVEFAVVENSGQIGDWRDAEGEADAHRLHLELAVSGEDEASAIHLYLPGFQKEGESASGLEEGGLDLPQHLDLVEVEVTIRLAECEISLSQLLSLEEGDVIPTSAHVDQPATILVEGKELAVGRLGTYRGNYAVHTEQLLDLTEESR